MNEEVLNVREAMKIMGFVVKERVAPKCQRMGTESFYCPINHEVVVAVNAEDKILWHELCHSQQPRHSPGYNLPDGKVNIGMWLASPFEQEARAVEELYAQQNWHGLALMATKYPLPLKYRFLAESKRIGEDKASLVMDGAISVSSSKKETESWINWLLKGSLAYHPTHLPKRKRQEMNALQAAVTCS